MSLAMGSALLYADAIVIKQSIDDTGVVNSLQKEAIIALFEEQQIIKNRLKIVEHEIDNIEEKIGTFNYVVTVFFANVRNKPSTKTGDVVTVYKMGTFVKIKTVQSDGWCETEDGLFIHIHVMQKLK